MISKTHFMNDFYKIKYISNVMLQFLISRNLRLYKPKAESYTRLSTLILDLSASPCVFLHLKI